MKKRVLVWETLATVSGGQKMTLTVLDMLREDYEFVCLIPGKGILSNELEQRNIPYLLMGDQTLPAGVKGKQVIFRYTWMSIKNICKSIKVIIQYKPDILYAPGPAALPWSAICGSLTHKPVIWHLHHIFMDGPTKKLLNLCGQWKSVRKIIAVSNCVGNQIVNEKAHKKIDVLYNPVNFQKYADGDADNVLPEISASLCKSFPLSQNTQKKVAIIGHIALIQRPKKQDFVLDVVAALKKKHYDIVGLFAGECRDEDYLEELNQKVDALNLRGDVLFLGRRNDIPDLLKTMDVLMIPSFEGFPLAGLEAASAGVPVVSCNVAGAEEFIQVSSAGEIFAENNVDAAVQAIEKIIANKEKYEKNGKRFSKKCTTEAYKDKIKISFMA